MSQPKKIDKLKAEINTAVQENRAQGNKLSDSERQALIDRGLRLVHGVGDR